MSSRIWLRLPVTAFLLLLTLMSATAQDVNNLKSAVVKIRNTKNGEAGTGFIVKIDNDLIYIVTSSHVVRGNENPEVYLYNRQHQDPLLAKLRYREDESQKGLALLTLKLADSRKLSGITAVSFGDSAQLDGGETVKVIGFPNDTSIWTVSTGTISRVEGNYLIFSGSIRGGNSGGPVILSNGQVIGMVTDTIESQDESSAAKAEIIVSYVNGLVPKLISISTSTEKRQDNSVLNDEFCKTLNKLLDASEKGFYPIVGDPTNSENTFYPNILLPGARGGYVLPQERVYYYLLNGIKEKGKVESQFYTVVSKVKVCMPNSEEKEEADSSYRYYKFRRSKGATVVRVYYNIVSQGENYFFLTLSLDLLHNGRSEW